MSSEPLGRTVTGAMAWSATGRFATMATTLVAQAFVARLLAPGEFGAYTLVISSAATVAFFSQAALPQSAVRLIAHAGTDGAAAVRGIVASVSRTTLAFTLVTVALSVGPLGEVVESTFPEVPIARIRIVFALLTGVRLVENVLPEVFRGLRDFRNASLFGGLASGVAIAGAFGALSLLDVDLGLAAIMWVTVLAALTPLLAGAVVLTRRVRTFPRPSARSPFDLRLLSPALWAGTAISFVITQMDLWVVGALRPQGDVALYGAAFRLSTLVMVPAAIANFVVPPLVVQMHARGERERLQRLLQTVAGIACVPAALLVGALVLFGDSVTDQVFGSYYRHAGPLVAILAAGKLGNVLTGACGITLVMTGGARANLVVMATNLVMTLALQVLAVHRFGLAGLAVATALGLVMQNLMLLVAARRRAGVWTFANPRLALERGGGWRGLRTAARDALRARGDDISGQ